MKNLSIFEPQIEKHHAYKKNETNMSEKTPLDLWRVAPLWGAMKITFKSSEK